MIINARRHWSWKENSQPCTSLLKSGQARPLCLCECSFLERDEEPISSRLRMSPASWRRLAALSGCNGDVGESGSGRFVLPVPGALAPSEVETRSSPVSGSTYGRSRLLPTSGSPNGLVDRSGIIRFGLPEAKLWPVGLADRSGIVRFGLPEAKLWPVGGPLPAASSGLSSSSRRCLLG